MMSRGLFMAIIIATFAMSAHAEDSKPVRISGSTSVANSVVQPHHVEIEKAAGLTIVVSPNSSGAGVTDLLAGNTDIAMISSDLNDLLTKMSNVVAAYKTDPNQLRSFDLGTAKVEFIVNQSNLVKKITAGQLKAIYLGELTNWKDVGGSAAEIMPFSEGRFGAMRTMVEHELLGGKALSDLVSEVSEAPQVAIMVARKSNGIGFISSTTPPLLRTGTVTIETDANIAQHLVLVTKGDPTPEVMRVIVAIAAHK